MAQTLAQNANTAKTIASLINPSAGSKLPNVSNNATTNINSLINASGNKSLSSAKGLLDKATQMKNAVNPLLNSQSATSPIGKANTAINSVQNIVSNPLSAINTFTNSKNKLVVFDNSSPASTIKNVVGGDGVESFTCGYNGDIDNKVPVNQWVYITSDSEGEIKAIIQETFSLSVDSQWEAFTFPGGKEAEQFTQLLSMGKLTLQNPVTSRRMWKGTSPITMSMDLKFVNVKNGNAKQEVIEPCCRLQRLTLPTIGDFKIAGWSLPLLNPPGPNPAFIGNENVNTGKGDQIKIKIGGFLNFDMCIIKSVDVSYDNKFDVDGLPISATAKVVFETYEIMTKDKYGNAVGLQQINKLNYSIEKTQSDSSQEIEAK